MIRSSAFVFKYFRSVKSVFPGLADGVRGQEMNLWTSVQPEC